MSKSRPLYFAERIWSWLKYQKCQGEDLWPVMAVTFDKPLWEWDWVSWDWVTLPPDRTTKAAFTAMELELATPKSQLLLKVQALLMFWPKKKIKEFCVSKAFCPSFSHHLPQGGQPPTSLSHSPSYLPGHLSQRNGNIFTNIHCNFIHVPKNRKQPKCPSVGEWLNQWESIIPWNATQ